MVSICRAHHALNRPLRFTEPDLYLCPYPFLPGFMFRFSPFNSAARMGALVFQEEALMRLFSRFRWRTHGRTHEKSSIMPESM